MTLNRAAFPKSFADQAMAFNGFDSHAYAAGSFLSAGIGLQTFPGARTLQMLLKLGRIVGGPPTVQFRLRFNDFVNPVVYVRDSGAFTPAQNQYLTIFVEHGAVPQGNFCEVVMDVAGAGTVEVTGLWMGTNFEEHPPRHRNDFPSAPFDHGAFEIIELLALRTNENLNVPLP